MNDLPPCDINFSIPHEDYGLCMISIHYTDRIAGLSLFTPPACHYYFEGDGRPLDPTDPYARTFAGMTYKLLEQTLQNSRSVVSAHGEEPLSPEEKEIIATARDTFKVARFRSLHN